MIRGSHRSLFIALLSSFCALTVGASARVAGVAAGPESWAGDLSRDCTSDWNYDRAAHLIERAGFGATPRRSRVSPR